MLYDIGDLAILHKKYNHISAKICKGNKMRDAGISCDAGDAHNCFRKKEG